MDTLIQAGITLPLPIGLAKQIPPTAVGRWFKSFYNKPVQETRALANGVESIRFNHLRQRAKFFIECSSKGSEESARLPSVGFADRERKRRRELLALDGILFMRVVG